MCKIREPPAMEFSEPPHTLSVENLQSRKYLVLDRDDNASILRHVYSRNLQLTKEFENFTRETAKRVISKYIDPYCGMLTECARMSSDSITGPSSPLWLSTAHADDVQKDMNLAEAPVRYRRGKKWKRRWAVLRRANPAADELSLILYKDEDHARKKQKQKAFVSLVNFCGLQLLNRLGKHFNVIVIITSSEVTRLSFQHIAGRSEFLDKLEEKFGQERSFDGFVRHKQKIKSGEATLRFYSQSLFFCLSRKDSFKCVGRWKLVDLPKYGAVESGFAFETTDTNSNDRKSMYLFETSKGKEIHQLFDSVCRAGEAGSAAATNQETVVMRNKEDENEERKANFLQRAWARMSGRGRRPPKNKQRPRSSSEPTLSGSRRRRFGRSNDKKTEARVDSNEQVGQKKSSSAGPEEQRELNDTQEEAIEAASPKTPPGYELMDGINVVKKQNKTAEYQNVDVLHSPEKQKESATSPTEDLSHLGYEFMWPVARRDTETRERKGKTEEKVESVLEGSGASEAASESKTRGNKSAEEGSSEEPKSKETSKDLESGDKTPVKIVVKVHEEEREKNDLKISVKVDQDSTQSSLRNSNESKVSKGSEANCYITTMENEQTDGSKVLERGEQRIKNQKENDLLLNGDARNGKLEEGNVVKETANKKQGPPVKERPKKVSARSDKLEEGSDIKETAIKKQGSPMKERPKKEKSPPKIIRSNGDLQKSRDSINEVNKENTPDSKNRSRTPRGFKNPPPEIISPKDQNNSYVNSDALRLAAEYVNIPGSQNKLRPRCKTTTLQVSSRSPGKSTDPYAMYDSNGDDSIYHSVESLMPGSGLSGYQNLKTISTSFDSIPTYCNVPAGNSSYQNLGATRAPRQDASYVNVPVRAKKGGRRKQDHPTLNYVEVEALEKALSSSTPSVHSRSPPKSSNSSSSNSNYTFIDHEKTEYLKQLASNRRKEQKEEKEKLKKV